MREYELVLMLDPGRDAPGRDAVAQEARKQIETGGTLKHENVWGLRKMAYEIDQRTEADYRWFRFEAPTELLEQLDHNLKIADGVLRFRIFKVGPEIPLTVPPATAATAPAASRERPAESAPGAAPSAAAEPAVAEPVPAEPDADADSQPVELEPAAAAEETAAEPEPSAEETAAAGEGDESAKSAE